MSLELKRQAPEMQQRGQDLLRQCLAAGQGERQRLRTAAVDLANELHQAGVGMCHSKATEFSPFIKEHFFLAAKLVLVVLWPDQAAIAPFERDVFYYRNFENTKEQVEQYEKFKADFIG